MIMAAIRTSLARGTTIGFEWTLYEFGIQLLNGGRRVRWGGTCQPK